ncbi:MAG: ABC transporter ATP-binding protein [Alphaproteobacteria bacterium]|nr:ABC transporter ATP-binding protein [Alphaproteobacteria bacterium]
MSLDVAGLAVTLDGRMIVSEASLTSVARGTMTALIGPNGAGKSTLLRGIAGLAPRRAGEVALDGRRLPLREARTRIALMPQSFAASVGLTVFEALLVALKQGRSWHVDAAEEARVAEVLDELGIEGLADRELGRLSGGQQQLAAMAQALVRDPDILLLDEPTSALDLHHQLVVLQAVASATRARALVTIFAVHDLSLAARFADRMVLIEAGRTVRDGAPAMLLADPRTGAAYGVGIDVVRGRRERLLVDADLALAPA